jgi:hypothetical protein
VSIFSVLSSLSKETFAKNHPQYVKITFLVALVIINLKCYNMGRVVINGGHGVKTSYKDVRDGRMDGRTCPLAIGRN